MSAPTFLEVVQGLHNAFASVPGLPVYDEAGTITNIVYGQPTSVQVTPFVYTLLDAFDKREQGQIQVIEWRLVHRLLVPNQDSLQAELDVTQFVESLPESVERDLTLGGLLSGPTSQGGGAWVDSGDVVYVKVAGVIYKALDYRSRVIVKRPRLRPQGL